MNLAVKLLLEGTAALAAGAGGVWIFLRWKEAKRRSKAEAESHALLDDARREAENITREARLAANEEVLKLRDQIEKSFAGRKQELAEREQRLSQREQLINGQLAGLVEQERAVQARQQEVNSHEAALQIRQAELASTLQHHKDQLQKLARITETEARALLLKQVEEASLKDAADISRRIVESTKARAEEQARRILSLALQRYAGTQTFESTTATLTLPGDEIKGRIIGREGRNIRAFEAATGVTVLIDDTPGAVVLSGFDPVRREIARESMQRLILDGRIHPSRIEEIVAQVNKEIEEAIVRAGEEAVNKLGLPPLHPEITKLLGRLRFRHSFAQNILDHSIEVAHLTGLLAAEIGADVTAAKRAGLLHDIGKALDHEVEGSHAIIGAEFIERHGESEDIINGVASHHDEVPHTNVLGILVSAADAISASRPGARSETMATYLKRLDNLERIGLSFEGVEKCFAVQAGRELRVMVHPDQINDEQAYMLARNIVRRIEDDLQYPGQIRVTVIRETRCVEFAK